MKHPFRLTAAFLTVLLLLALSGSGSGSGSGSAPAHSAIFTAHTSQEVFTAPAWHFSVQVQTAGSSSWVSPSSI